ncbi:sugar-phosphatase [Vibrio sp. HA2012]|uniref:sugar-phosphatase n=1 Tax=Vibrio sp. HA2012 TaxID=1971595 RepID=UPI000C2BBCFD|nr:sugar-phosphatase [Vibrio sp. HA2012]PJC87922.1 sugar-phosphatase [Vibrio sp. HA2012]
MYKLVALDMDGTLLNSQKMISQRNREAIAKARALGVTVVLASGRPVEGMMAQVRELNMTSENDFVLSYNASLVQRVSDGEVIRSQILTGKENKQLAALSQKLGVNIHAFSQKYGLITPKNSKYTQHEADINGLEVTTMDFFELDDDHQIIKTMLIDEPELLDKAISAFPEALYDQFTIVRSSPFFLEFLNKNSNKGAGVKMVADYLGLTPDQVICMGDAENDHHMLEYAGLGIAMGNAMEQTKAIADYVTDSNDDHGVATAIEKFILNA